VNYVCVFHNAKTDQDINALVSADDMGKAYSKGEEELARHLFRSNDYKSLPDWSLIIIEPNAQQSE
jgi:hypothetical protein